MTNPWIDTDEVKKRLADYFTNHRTEIQDFGNTVNQTFEAFVFASLVKWYDNHGWHVEFKQPQPDCNYVKLKYSTRGRPSQYTYALCAKGQYKVQVRHSLRVATKHHRPGLTHSANVVLDVAVISDIDLSKYKTDDHVDNSCLFTFGEAKHMSAFAELIANFIGLVHEISPHHLTIRLHDKSRRPRKRAHPAPFLYVSGYLYPTAQGITETIKDRGYDIEICDCLAGAKLFGIQLPVTFPKKSTRKTKSAPSAPSATS